MTQNKQVLIIAGPTASGKSALAVELAESLNGVIINADSVQVYKDLSIISARPNTEDSARVPHRLYGIFQAEEPCSVALWRELALQEIKRCHQEGLLPIVVGGTGLYIKALMEGLAQIPEIDPEIRAKLRSRLDSGGIEILYKELQQQDQVTAEKLKPKDQQRILRALEVIESTGRPLSDWQKENTPTDKLDFITVVLLPDREELLKRAALRFEAMIKMGALEEVKSLDEKALDARSPILKALGFKELRDYIHGRCMLDEAIAKAQIATRQYIKRQYTWFRHQLAGAYIINDFHHQDTFREVKLMLKEHEL